MKLQFFLVDLSILIEHRSHSFKDDLFNMLVIQNETVQSLGMIGVLGHPVPVQFHAHEFVFHI